MKRPALRGGTLVTLAISVVVAVVGPRAIAAAAEDAQVTISAVDVSAAPTVTLTVGVEGALAGDTLPADAFTLRASGKERPATITGLPSDPMQVELVIDTSGSMEGAPLAAAKQAADALVSTLPDWAAVGIVGFGDEPYGALDATRDRTAITDAIDALQSGGETALYDAVTLASQRFVDPRRALVVLSDGRDTASAATLEQAAAAVGDARAATHVVVLQTPEADLAAAGALAGAAGGQLVEAENAGALERVYTAIAGRLAATYQVSFEAVTTGSTGMEVVVSARGVTASAAARASVPLAASATPPVTDAPRPVDARPERAPEPGLLEQKWVLPVGLAALFAALFLCGIVLLTRPPRPSQLAGTRELRRASRGNTLQALGAQATGFAERSLDRSGKRRGLERALEEAGVNMRAAEFALLVACGAFAAFAVGLALGGMLVGLALAATLVIAARLSVGIARDRRRGKFADQLEQTLPLMAGSLRAGYGLMQALDAVAQESAEPTSIEFRRLVSETRLGRDLSDGLHALGDRMANEDFAWVVQAIEIHQQVGGDLAEVLDKVHATIRDRNRIRRQISALSGEGRLSAAILFTLPIAMFVFISIANPEYIGELTGSGLGVALLVVGLGLMLAGGVWMRRITRLVF